MQHKCKSWAKIITNIPPQHKISKAVVINCGYVAPNNTGVNTLLSYVNWTQALQASMIITQQTMNSEQAYHAEITQNLQDITSTTVIIPISSSKLFKTFLLPLQYLDYRRFLYKGL